MLPNDTGGGALTAAEVLAYAVRVSRTRADVGINLCQRFVRMAFGSGGGAATALQAWQQSRYKHTAGTPPPGAAVYWGGGAGHVAISAGNGMVYSTDAKQPGKVDLVPISFITNQWGKPLLGWSADNNGIRITKWNAQPVEGAGEVDYTNAGGGGGTTAGGGVATTYSKKQLRERYGFAAAFFESSPELQRLLNRAVKAQWQPDEFEARLRDTKWYRKHTEAEREWLVLSTSQPAEAERQVASVRAEIVNLYRNMGVPVGKGRVDKIAAAAVKHGWTETEIQNAVAAEFDYKPDTTFGGVAGETIDDFRAMQSAYLVPLSNKTMERWTEHVLRGEATPEQFESYLKDQAKSLWNDPQIQAAIDRGQTVADYLNPYAELAASELEINPEDIDWTANKWSKAVWNQNEKGERAVMSLADWQRTLRTDQRYGYDKTSGARDAAAQLATEFGQRMGAFA